MHNFILAALLSISGSAFSSLPPNMGKYFNQDHPSCFLIKKLGTNSLEVFGESQCRSRRSPYSTYKILNSLIALETGVVTRDTVIPWDGEKKFIKQWEQDHNLASAIKYSVVPFYQEVARRIGKERMKKYVDLVNYGNKEIGDVIDRFWLDGPIEISAYEQLDFVERLYLSELPFKKENQEFVREILIHENKKDRTFSGKTGSDYENGKFIFGWFVGHLRSGDDEYIFVTNSKGEGETGSNLKKVARTILKDMSL